MLWVFLTATTAVSAQGLLKGIVVNAETNAPVPKASVFLNNTSVGATANDSGRFELSIPAGRYELIVSSIGYNTHLQVIAAADVPDFLTIRLTTKTEQMEAVVIEPYLKDGWEKWGRFFLENFIGTTAQASDCKILNKDAIRFRNSKKANTLTAHASEPLLIENKALGYRIRYQLESFVYDFNTRYVLYLGYPFFEQLECDEKKLARWEKKRREVYEGSILHFMRSLYCNHLLQDGYEVRRLQKLPNAEKQRVRNLYRQQTIAVTAGHSVAINQTNPNSDSVDYYQDVLEQPDFREMIGKDLLPGDSIAFAVDSVTAGLSFPDYLYVNYKKGSVPPEFLRQYPTGVHARLSHLQLVNTQLISVQANGMYYNPVELVISGYWGWSEKIAAMLPFDYWPNE